jgi:hypothetical protein
MPILLSAVCLILCFSSGLHAHESDVIKPMAQAFTAYLNSLDTEQRLKTHLPFDANSRYDWHYVPKDRKGLSWKQMTAKQQQLSKEAFILALSEAGYRKVQGVLAAEEILWELSGQSEFRNPQHYYVTVFGEPSTEGSWAASLEGHHLSINLTVIDGHEIFVSPSFFGSNPDHHDSGPFAGKRPLGGEADQAPQFFAMLDQEQQAKALIAEAPIREIITRAEPRVAALEATGLSANSMTVEQRAQLRRLIFEYLGRYRAPITEDDLQKIDAAGFENIHFACAGRMQPGQPMYYRVQGPTFLLEYANVQNGGNHSHTVWRDFASDFGYSALKDHLEAAH